MVPARQTANQSLTRLPERYLERAMGIEPIPKAWRAPILPLN
jgi:hypothetical protein